jgi:hypothetical protein
MKTLSLKNLSEWSLPRARRTRSPRFSKTRCYIKAVVFLISEFPTLILRSKCWCGEVQIQQTEMAVDLRT